MDGRRFLLGQCLVLAAPLLVAAQDPNQPIRDIVSDVKKRAVDQKREDQRRALQLLQRAESARKAGRAAEAVELARKAQVLFPESVDIRQAAAGLSAEQREGRGQAANLMSARACLDEALEHVGELLAQRRLTEARDLADAVRDALGMFPSGFDVAGPREAAERILSELTAKPDPNLETIPVLPQPVRDAPLSPSDMQLALARRIDVEWRDQPLSTVFPIVLNETGLKVTVDPDLARLGLFEQQRADLRIHNVTMSRLLRMVTDMAGASYILRDGEVYITTKANALAHAVARPEGRIDPLPPLRPTARRAVALPEPLPPGSLLPPPGIDKTPDHLLSGRALLERVTELLRSSESTPRTPEGK